MRFEWDKVKSAANLEKHGISFSESAGLWRDPNMIAVRANRNGEQRWVALARMSGAVWAAVYTERGDAIRIISVRKATLKEAASYDKANR